MIDEKKIYNYIKEQINPYGKPFTGTVYEFGLKIMDYIENIEKVGEWIPCSERLPHEPKTNPVLEGKNLELYLVTTKYGSDEIDEVYPFRAFWNGVNFTDGWHILDVIAWMPLPELYKGE